MTKDFADLDWTAAKAENARLRERERALIDELTEARRLFNERCREARVEVANARASALEEAARKVESTVLVWNGYEWGYSRAVAAESIRALAKSPPSGRFVADEVMERVESDLRDLLEWVSPTAVMKFDDGDVLASDVLHRSIAALAALNEGKR